MSHQQFQTCAPRVIFMNGGYKVNSTYVTIIDGTLYPLIDIDDKVAHSTGAFFIFVDWKKGDAQKSIDIAKQSASELTFQGDIAILNGKRFNPIGKFLPSKVTLQDNGFCRYDWSEFVESKLIRYAHILVVDDSADWIKKVQTEFNTEANPEVLNLELFETSDKVHALRRILESNPDALILDVHLTPDEQFDVLWIANQLFANNFAGKILLASSYDEASLKAMQKLIRGPVKIPGKNLENVRKCLSTYD